MDRDEAAKDDTRWQGMALGGKGWREDGKWMNVLIPLAIGHVQ